MKTTAALLVILAIIICVPASAAVPPIINYQGKLLQPTGAPVPDGTYSVQFAIYAAPIGGAPLWSETNTAVQVKGGLFAVLLGSVPPGVPSNIFDQPNRFFGVKVGSGPEMTPRQQIASVAYAVKAGSADIAATVPDSAVTTSKVADAAISTAKLIDGSVTATKIGNSSITLGYAEMSAPFSATTVGSYVDVPGLSVTVSVPPGGRRIKITAFAHYVGDNTTNRLESGMFCDAIRLNESQMTVTPNSPYPLCHISTHVPTPGIHTYKLSLFQTYPGTMFLDAAPNTISYILVELI